MYGACVMQQVNKTIYNLIIIPFGDFAYNRPAKSTPTLENGAASLTLNSGSAATGGDPKG